MDSQSPQLDLIRPIGRGAGGTILYKAIHRTSGEIYAVKVIDACYEDDVFRNVRRQVQILSDVDSPNVVKCHGVNFHPHHHGAGGEIHLLLEYVENSLEGAYVPHEPTLSYLARQILAGLEYLHGRAIAHRDIAPSNLLINPQGVVKIADFGVSTVLAQTADPFEPSILDYMCPERIDTNLIRGRRDELAFSGDIWSFGICILEFYLGKFPIPVGRQGDWARLMSAICYSNPPVAPPQAKAEFRDFIACCLQKDPSKRMTADRLLKHPFITQNLPPSPVSQSSDGGYDSPGALLPEFRD